MLVRLIILSSKLQARSINANLRTISPENQDFPTNENDQIQSCTSLGSNKQDLFAMKVDDTLADSTAPSFNMYPYEDTDIPVEQTGFDRAKRLYNENKFVKELRNSSINIEEQGLDGFYDLLRGQETIVSFTNILVEIESRTWQLSNNLPILYAILAKGDPKKIKFLEDGFNSSQEEAIYRNFFVSLRSKGDALKDPHVVAVEYMNFTLEFIVEYLKKYNDENGGVLTVPLLERVLQIKEFGVFFDSLTDEYKDVPPENILLFLTDVVESNMSILRSYLYSLTYTSPLYNICFETNGIINNAVLLRNYFNNVIVALNNIKKEMTKENLMNYSRGKFLIDSQNNGWIRDITPKINTSFDKLGIDEDTMLRVIDEVHYIMNEKDTNKMTSLIERKELSIDGYSVVIPFSGREIKNLDLITPKGMFKLKIISKKGIEYATSDLFYNSLVSPYINTAIKVFYINRNGRVAIYNNSYFILSNHWDEEVFPVDCKIDILYIKNLFRDILNAIKYLHKNRLSLYFFDSSCIMSKSFEDADEKGPSFRLSPHPIRVFPNDKRGNGEMEPFEAAQKNDLNLLLKSVKEDIIDRCLPESDNPELKEFIEFFRKQLDSNNLNIDDLLSHPFIPKQSVYVPDYENSVTNSSILHKISDECLDISLTVQNPPIPEKEGMIFNILNDQILKFENHPKIESDVFEDKTNFDGAEQVAVNTHQIFIAEIQTFVHPLDSIGIVVVFALPIFVIFLICFYFYKMTNPLAKKAKKS